MDIINDMLKTKKRDSNKSVYDKDLDKYNLEDWQKEEVRKGFQDPWSFEENEDEDYVDDDNLYYEDHRSE